MGLVMPKLDERDVKWGVCIGEWCLFELTMREARFENNFVLMMLALAVVVFSCGYLMC
jgi:hypothetical protein